MKVFFLSIVIIVATLAVIMLVSLLYNWQFVQQHFSRQLVVGILQLLTLFVGFRLLQELNKQEINKL